MNVLYQELEEKSEIHKDIIQQNIDKLDELIENEILKNKSISKRIITAFPNIKSLKYESSLDRLK